MKGYALVVARSRFRVAVAGAGALPIARFAPGSRRTFCPVCGVAAFYVPRSDPDKIDVNCAGCGGIGVAGRRSSS